MGRGAKKRSRLSALLLASPFLLAACNGIVRGNDTADAGSNLDEGPVCKLEPGGVCTSTRFNVLCCPRTGFPYDFERGCWERRVEPVLCVPERLEGICDSPPSVDCGATAEGDKAWRMGAVSEEAVEGAYVSCNAEGYLDSPWCR